MPAHPLLGVPAHPMRRERRGALLLRLLLAVVAVYILADLHDGGALSFFFIT